MLSLVLGRVTDRSVTVSAITRKPIKGFFEYGTKPGRYTRQTSATDFPAGEPVETVFEGLEPNTEYFYSFRATEPNIDFPPAPSECRFHTQRATGCEFTFAIQGDSHPERPQMSDPALYARTLQHVAAARPDLYICMGDDFSIERLRTFTAESVADRYRLQRPFLGIVARSAPIYLLNGNHEQASLFNYNQSGVAHHAAIFAQNARNLYFPTPAPDDFYTGNDEPLAGIGLLKNYVSWSWGDALFVILDNYWHSASCVDTSLEATGGGKSNDGHKNRDWWAITLGDVQYRWFKRTLETSNAKYKFVFAHHVLGTGRGGIDESDLYEWGGRDKRGNSPFHQKRPGWEMPVHQLMVKHGVTVFFQGHDHLFARQERDGIIYQEVPMPADPGYAAYNADKYASGVKLPNSGFLQVSVSPERVKVDYVRTYLPKDETDQRKTGEIAYSYSLPPRTAHS